MRDCNTASMHSFIFSVKFHQNYTSTLPILDTLNECNNNSVFIIELIQNHTINNISKIDAMYIMHA